MTYSERARLAGLNQTELLEVLRDRLQSIATLAVQAQDNLGNPDAVFDALTDIEDDTNYATHVNVILTEVKK